jgi:DNA (cytosine-5)-methyltransferase 1
VPGSLFGLRSLQCGSFASERGTMKSIELFVGAGGLALATANAGFDHDVVIERDQNACDTIRRNKAAGMAHVRDWRVWQGDVTKYDFRPHAGTIEFVSGGPPCQPFSIGGKHTGMDDCRNMFPQAAQASR